MKKSKLKSLVKTARKTAEKDIHQSLLASLKDIVGKFGEGSKKLNKDVEKGAKQLSKKLAKSIKVDKSAFIVVADPAIVNEAVNVAEPILVKKEAKAKKVIVPEAETEKV